MPTPFLTFLTSLALPTSPLEDTARREFILNILLLAAIALLFAASVIDTVTLLFSYAPEANALPSLVIDGLLIFFVLLYVLSRKGYVFLTSYLLLGSFFVLTAYMGLVWGVDLPAQIVFYPLVIVMASILISTRVAFFVTLLIAVTMAVTATLHYVGIVAVNTYWRQEAWSWSDIVMIILIYVVVATVAWLGNREIEKSLKRARKSEAELKEERDSLEIRVEERTRELRQAQMEKLSQAYHFVEFGRLAGGIFHDLVNPLTALSLNIDRIADSAGKSAMSEDVARAKSAAAHMQKLMESMRRHLVREGSKEVFSVTEVLKEICQILTTYAATQGVRMNVMSKGSIYTYGDPVAFAQVITNLATNAIHAYGSGEPHKRQGVILEVEEREGIYIHVKDSGSGIAPELLDHIFEPFYSTKASKGIGIGLPLARRIVEKDFGGTLSVTSRIGEGSTFTVYLPIREP